MLRVLFWHVHVIWMRIELMHRWVSAAVGYDLMVPDDNANQSGHYRGFLICACRKSINYEQLGTEQGHDCRLMGHLNLFASCKVSFNKLSTMSFQNFFLKWFQSAAGASFFFSSYQKQLHRRLPSHSNRNRQNPVKTQKKIWRDQPRQTLHILGKKD